VGASSDASSGTEFKVPRTKLVKAKREVYIGLVAVVPRSGNTDWPSEAKGAYVNALAIASGQEDFSEQVSQSLSDAGFEVQEIEDIEPLATRKAHHEIDPDLEELSEVVLATGRPEFGAFTHSLSMMLEPMMAT
jgi:hypothetical protein